MRLPASLFLTLVSGLLACTTPASPNASPPADGPTASGFPMAMVDDAGRQVTIGKLPERIVSLAPSNTEILFALGAGDRLVAVDQYSNYPPEAKQKVQLGSYVRPDLEQVIAAAPDLVLATGIHERTVVPQIEARGLAVVVIEGKNVDEVFARIERVGRMIGREAQAQALVRRLQARASAIEDRVAGLSRPRVFFELSPQLHTAGPGSFVDDMIRRAGGQNVAADAAVQWPQLSQEVLIERNPEVIVLSHDGQTPEQVAARPGWRTLAAVQNRRIVAIDPDLTSRPGPRVVDGLEAMARALHPQRFEGTP